ncbi:uncharacterized protein LOC100822432 isoform X2 [Brachypodium distachyon]|uniref:AB hydrolase-1 domain-containing protein n=1 Tax=Brachypodium distachyon TaxID=15368 RepID=I1HH06_BRADI|nr:uncharacterized protein LOC100822432 isoform X2 [Brachypodium distachyon]KQK05119.1 hypothetical protein BRADI_2g18130v3 [Brachypodium distachyon]|eukprot:XP_010231086.1 uncharacterized protein LOC100822432 isoform X2 [Brachypodium distachyon]
MPYCEVDRYQDGEQWEGVRLFYTRHGRGATKVLLVVGLAGTGKSWAPQIKGLTGSVEPADEENAAAAPQTADEETGGAAAAPEDDDGEGIEVCCFDNRGVGSSTILPQKSHYSTTIMAKDALALLDHLGWKKAHVFGHSMGAMISCKLAAMAPHRISSLALLNVTGGGMECFPKLDGPMLSLAFRFLRATTPELRAHVDLDTHYTKEYLDEKVESCTRREVLYKEYVKNISSTGMQSSCGFEGQLNSCWTHKMTTKELDTIRDAGFLVSVIHGRSDIIAQLCHARRLAERLAPAARMVELQGAHLVSHERPEEVNNALMELIKATKSMTTPHEWSSQPENTSGLIMMGFEHMRNIVRVMKPVKVAAIES